MLYSHFKEWSVVLKPIQRKPYIQTKNKPKLAGSIKLEWLHFEFHIFNIIWCFSPNLILWKSSHNYQNLNWCCECFFKCCHPLEPLYQITNNIDQFQSYDLNGKSTILCYLFLDQNKISKAYCSTQPYLQQIYNTMKIKYLKMNSSYMSAIKIWIF